MEWLVEIIKQILFYTPNIQGLVLADPVTAIAISGLVGAGAGYFGNKSAANTMAGASNQAAQYGLQGQREGIQSQQYLYGEDRQREAETAQWLQQFLPNFNTTLPDPNKYFGQNSVNDAYNLSKKGLNQSYQQVLGNATSGASENAAARGLLNPSLLTRQAANDVNQSFIPQFTGLEANRASALIGQNKDLYSALLNNNNYLNTLAQLGYSNRAGIASQFGSPTGYKNPYRNPYGG